MTNMKCLKCGLEGLELPQKPYPGDLGDQILKNICQSCFEGWKKHSVMVINDHKLRPFLPKDRAFLENQMRQFFNFIPPDPQDPQGPQGLPLLQALTEQGKK